MVMVSPERFSMVVRALTILNPMKNKLTPAIKMQRERERERERETMLISFSCLLFPHLLVL